MLAGHYAPAYALKARHPDVPLWLLFLAVQAVDIAFFALVALGVERMALVPGQRGGLALDLQHLPWTHSLATAVVLGVGCWLAGRATGRATLGAVIGAAVASHWVCDLLVHVPDLPLAPGLESPRLGLGLWRMPLVGFAVEIGLLVAAYAMARPRLAPDRRRWGDVGVAALVVVQVLNDFVMPPPASVASLAASGEALFLGAVLLATPVDRRAALT